MEVSVGNILTFFLVIIGFLALSYQARSVKIAEKELRTKVVEINELLQKIEHEGKQREKETIDRINSHADLTESQASMYRELLFIGRGYECGILEHIETIAISTSILAKNYQLHENQTNQNSIFHELMTYIQKVQADMIDLSNFSQKWTNAIAVAGDESKTKREKIRIKGFNNLNTVKMLIEEQYNYKEKIKQIQEEYSSKATIHRNKYDTSKSSFVKLLKECLAEDGKE